MRVSMPWNLSTYIPLNSFHPLYKSLVKFAPESIEFSVLDTAAMYHEVYTSEVKRRKLVSHILKVKKHKMTTGWIVDELEKELSLPDSCFSGWLPGDIEFLHTAPFPSFTKPFIFHCEAFSPIFFPFSHQGDGKLRHKEEIIEYYISIFESDLCIGIFSHIPETLDSFKKFFNSDIINKKLNLSKIGVVTSCECKKDDIDKDDVTFLFINSAHQSKDSFIKRGGHVVLKFWEKIISKESNLKLILRCGMPDENILKDLGVNVDFLKDEIGNSIIWSEDYLPCNELDSLVKKSDFILIPSASLHSVTILSAMSLGTIPVVTDTIGPNLYVKDNVNGIVLSGVYENIWFKDKDTSIMFDDYSKFDISLSNKLADEMFHRIFELLKNRNDIISMVRSNIEISSRLFNPKDFSRDFWGRVNELYKEYINNSENVNFEKNKSFPITMNDSLFLSREELIKNFDSTPQPVLRFSGSNTNIYEYCGNYICYYGFPTFSNKLWSFFEQFINDESPKLIIERDIFNLEGVLIPPPGSNNFNKYVTPYFVRVISNRISKIPFLFYILRFFYRRIVNFIIIGIEYYKYRASISKGIDIDSKISLVAEGINGFNIIKLYGRYYGVKQSLGEFKIENYNKGLYGKLPSSYSIDSLLNKIERKNIFFIAKSFLSKYLNNHPSLKRKLKKITKNGN